MKQPGSPAKPGWTARRRNGIGATNGGAPGTTHASRAVPGKAPRLSPPYKLGRVITPLGRLVLDDLDRGVMVLDENGAVLDANLPALRILDGRNGLGIRNGRLGFSDAEFDQRFVRLVAQRRAAPGSATRSIAARLKRSRAQPYFVQVRPMPPHTDARGVAMAVIVYAPNERREISIELLRELYGLTAAQARVARQLYAGRSVEQAAVALRLSLNTVRTHLKQVFTKCDVRSQAELMHLLAQGPSSL